MASEVRAATINAASCSQANVQSAINSASAGDTVAIPAGTCSWTGQVSWSAPAGVTLQGAGDTTVGGGDQTIITDDYTTNAPLLSISVSNTGTFRMTGLTFQGGTGGLKENGILSFGGPGTIRLDHLHLNKQNYSDLAGTASSKVMVIGGGIRGVLDHSIIDLYGIGWIHIVNGTNSGNTDWASATGFGTSDFFFIEDNQINGTTGGTVYDSALTDCHTGGKYVVRFNTLVATAIGQTHPTGHSSDDRGCRAHEIYGNVVTSPLAKDPNFTLDYNNSGSALDWGNSATNVFKNIFYFNSIRQNNSTYTQSATPNGWGYCGTAFNGTGSNWDENSDASTGYACIDDPGRGQGDLLTGDFPSKINSTTGTIHWPNQALEPIYIWNNTASVVAGWGGNFYANLSNGRIASDREYYTQASGVQTSASSPFDGTTGTGWGTLARRPTTCTTGVGYFATDQGSWNESTSNSLGVQQNGADGVLYKCTSTNTWTSYYTPYTYPHPLVSGAADTTAPTITSVSSDKANGSYTVGEVIDIDVTFSEAVTSTGLVTVALETGTTDRTCTFTVSNSSTGTCNYTIQTGDASADLTTNSISGTIADQSSNAMSDFTPATNLAANKALVIDTTNPTGSITAPTNGTTVSGASTTVSASASDNTGVASVQFKLDGSNLGSADTTNPYSITWNTTGASNGSHSITAVVTDTAGNTLTTSAVSVTVSNSVADTSPPARSAGSPSGALAAGTTSTTLSLSTDESATCKYGTTANTAYSSIGSTFTTTGSTTHSATLSGLSNNTSYTYYVRCQDGSSNPNSDDYPITFSIAAASSGSSGGGGGGGGSSHKKKKTASRTISMSSTDVARGSILVQRGKKFSKSSPVLLYFSRSQGGYYPPQRVITSSTGTFSVSYRVTKPVGSYAWFATDVKTGKTSKVKVYRVRQ